MPAILWQMVERRSKRVRRMGMLEWIDYLCLEDHQMIMFNWKARDKPFNKGHKDKNCWGRKGTRVTKNLAMTLGY